MREERFDFEVAETLEERNRRLKHQVDPITGAPVVLLTKKAFLELQEKELKRATRKPGKDDRPTQSEQTITDLSQDELA